MSGVVERLQSLRVGDLMNRQVVEVSANQSMCEAANLFSEKTVAAAPVTDEHGVCVGILSATDFLTRECLRNSAEHGSIPAERHDLVRSGSEPWHIETVDEERVRTHMSTAVQSVSESASMLSAARIMCAQHVHRLVVLNEQQHPIGVISTTDVVAALLNAIDESNVRR